MRVIVLMALLMIIVVSIMEAVGIELQAADGGPPWASHVTSVEGVLGATEAFVDLGDREMMAPGATRGQGPGSKGARFSELTVPWVNSGWNEAL